MECSRLGYQIWAIAIFQMKTNIKGISSMKLHRDLDITLKSAWSSGAPIARYLVCSSRPIY